MFIINEDKSIYITRGDVAFFSIEAKTDTGEKFKFQPGDVVRFKVCEKKACENVVLSKDFGIETEAEEVSIYLEEKDTKFGSVISKPKDYWYEVELNPYTDPQTIIGYDEDGAKIFKLFPEGNEKEDEEPITPEDIPVVDSELDLTSTRPVQNQAIARAFLKVNEDIDARMSVIEHEAEELMGEIREGSIDYLTDAKGHRVVNVANPEAYGDAVNLGYAEINCMPHKATFTFEPIDTKNSGLFRVSEMYSSWADFFLAVVSLNSEYKFEIYEHNRGNTLFYVTVSAGEPVQTHTGSGTMVLDSILADAYYFSRVTN